MNEQIVSKDAFIRELQAKLKEQAEVAQKLADTITRLHDRRARAQQRHRQIVRELRAAALDGAPAIEAVEEAEAARPKA